MPAPRARVRRRWLCCRQRGDIDRKIRIFKMLQPSPRTAVAVLIGKVLACFNPQWPSFDFSAFSGSRPSSNLAMKLVRSLRTISACLPVSL
jgi:hypothetical protein